MRGKPWIKSVSGRGRSKEQSSAPADQNPPQKPTDCESQPAKLPLETPSFDHRDLRKTEPPGKN